MFQVPEVPGSGAAGQRRVTGQRACPEGGGDTLGTEGGHMVTWHHTSRTLHGKYR